MATLVIADLDNGKRDLETVDAVANSQSDTTGTRQGQQVMTLAGTLRRLGYSVPVPYAPGLSVTSGVFTVARGGVLYAPRVELVPFTTAAWDPAQWRPIQNMVATDAAAFFLTKPEADAAAATLPEGSFVVVLRDGTKNNAEVTYSVSGGALVEARDPMSGENIAGPMVGYSAEYTHPADMTEAVNRNYPFGTEFFVGGAKFVVSPSAPALAGAYYRPLQAGAFAVAADVFPTASLGDLGSFKKINSTVLSDYTICQNALYDQVSQKLVVTHTKKVSGNEVGAFSVHSFDGTTFGPEEFSIKGLPAGHFSYTALQRKGADLYLWFSHYLTDASGPRGIGRIKVAPGSVAEVMVPNVTVGDGHSALRLGAYGTDGIYYEVPSVGSKKKYASFSDMESGKLTGTAIEDKRIESVTGQYYFQALYSSASNWLVLTGQTGNVSRNGADAAIFSCDSNGNDLSSFDVNIPQAAAPSGYYEPQGLFSRWNRNRYDIYVIFASGNVPTEIGVLHVNASGVNASPVVSELGMRSDWRESLGTLSNPSVGGEAVPTLETPRALLTSGDLYVGSSQAGSQLDHGVDPRMFRIRQSFGTRSARRQAEIAYGRSEVTVRMIPFGDSIFEQQLSFQLRYLDGGTEKTSDLTFSKTFGLCAGQGDRIPNAWVSGGRWGLFKNAGFQSNEKSVGFSALNSGSSVAVSYLSYSQNGNALDLATTSAGNGLKLGGVTIPAAPNDSTISDPKTWLFLNGLDVRPGTDNTVSCGTGAFRWKQVYAGTGSINTSDEREKHEWRSLDEAEKAAAIEIKASLRAFKFIGGKRWHFGAGAQTVGALMRSHGLDPAEYAFWCFDEWEEERNEKGDVVSPGGNRFGIRYDELAMFLVMAS